MVDCGGGLGASKEQSFEGDRYLTRVADVRPGIEVVAEIYHESGWHEWVLRGVVDPTGSCDDPAKVDTGQLRFD